MTDKKSLLIAQQRERILNAAKACFVANGLPRTTMREIADNADMSLGNIYRYFANKEALIAAFIESDNHELGVAFALLDTNTDFKAQLCIVGSEIIKEMATKAQLQLYADVLSEALRDEKIRSIASLDHAERSLLQSLTRAIKEERVQLSVSAETAALAIISFIENAALKAVTNKKYSLRTASKQFKEFINIVILA